MEQATASHFDYVHMAREKQRAPLPNPAPQPNPPPQAPVNVVAQKPVTVGAETQQNSTSGWKTAALWVAGVAASTIIAYLVTKALVKTEEHVRKNGWLPNPIPETPDPVVPKDEPRLAEVLSKVQSDVQDIQTWISAQGKAAA